MHIITYPSDLEQTVMIVRLKLAS